MKILLCLVLGLACVAAQTQCPPETQEERAYRKVIRALDAFSIHLYQEVCSGKQGNLVVSPLSLAIVLVLTWLGANGRSAQQLGDVLHLPLSRLRVAQGYGYLVDTLPTANNQSDDEAQLRLANRLYVDSGYSVKETFKMAVQEFRSGVEKIDFADSENARQIINQWVANNTNGRILDLISPDVISSDTVMVLVNALLFSANWLYPFDESDTSIETFHLSESEQVAVSMMHGSFQLDYCELPDFNATAIRLPYKGSDFQSDMVILLPNSTTGLKDLEKNLGQLELFSIQCQIKKVTLSLPSFTINTTLDTLKEKMEQLGVKDIFSDTLADLSRISNYFLYVSEVVQKVYINVNENGTEAAAASGVIFEPRRISENVVFEANRPFLFIIRIEKRIAFMGRVVNPNQ